MPKTELIQLLECFNDVRIKWTIIEKFLILAKIPRLPLDFVRGIAILIVNVAMVSFVTNVLVLKHCPIATELQNRSGTFVFPESKILVIIPPLVLVFVKAIATQTRIAKMA